MKFWGFEVWEDEADGHYEFRARFGLEAGELQKVHRTDEELDADMEMVASALRVAFVEDSTR